jgi:hypothetical protein
MIVWQLWHGVRNGCCERIRSLSRSCPLLASQADPSSISKGAASREGFVGGVSWANHLRSKAGRDGFPIVRRSRVDATQPAFQAGRWYEYRRLPLVTIDSCDLVRASSTIEATLPPEPKVTADVQPQQRRHNDEHCQDRRGGRGAGSQWISLGKQSMAHAISSAGPTTIAKINKTAPRRLDLVSIRSIVTRGGRGTASRNRSQLKQQRARQAPQTLPTLAISLRRPAQRRLARNRTG